MVWGTGKRERESCMKGKMKLGEIKSEGKYVWKDRDAMKRSDLREGKNGWREK